ncbi:SGNH/GDSL hydrolase family protein [Thalassotalea sp. Y01]|uniref:GDSL-type esterase/lipase family protein n=1 Tax=Thalassotalea sp. Y01 TaxID=2729613 RepID=UPI00145D50B7|nr:SGNH/GDSL hydrolase family protein [Thalassotalea sp. Y01]
MRRTVPKMDEPNGNRYGETGMGKNLKLLVLGDSSAAGVGVKHQKFALLGRLVNQLSKQRRVQWRLHAKSGATTEDAILQMDQLANEQYDVVISALGVNDVTGLVEVDEWLDLQHILRDKIQRKFAPRLILHTAIPPIDRMTALPQPLKWFMADRGREFDRALKFSCDRYSQHFRLALPPNKSMVAMDGFHPGRIMYRIWAKQAAKRILTSI